VASYIDWFLVELDRRLEGRIGREHRFRVLSEAEDHLRSKADELAAVGMSPDAVERTAVASFGQPEMVAFEVSEATHSAKRAALGRWIVLFTAAAASCGLVALLLWGGWSGAIAKCAGILFAALLPLIVGTAIGRRAHPLALAALGVPFVLVTAVLMPITHVLVFDAPVAKSQLGFVREMRQDDLETNLQLRSALQQGMDYYASLRAHRTPVGTPPQTPTGQFIVIPPAEYSTPLGLADLGLSAAGHLSGHGHSFHFGPSSVVTVDQPRDAVMSWVMSGPGQLKRLDSFIAVDQRMLADLDGPSLNSARSVSVLAGWGSFMAAGFVAGIVVIQAVLALLCYRIRRAEFSLPRSVRA